MTQTLSELAASLWPFLNEYLQPRLDAISSTGGSTSASTTTLSTADYPDALLRDGSRSLLGNLAVATGKTIDNVDISEFYDSYIAHLTVDAHSIYVEKDSADTITAVHTFSPSTATAPFILAANAQGQTITGLQADSLDQSVIAGTGLTGGGTLTSNVTLNVGAGLGLVGNADDIAVGAGTGITVNADDVAVDQAFSPTWTGTHQFNSTINASTITPRTTDTYDLGSTTKLWRKGYLSELEALLFVENSISVIGGWFYITKDQGTLAATALTGDVKIDFGKAMTPNDFVVMRSSLQVEYIQVGTLDSGTLYNVTRDLDGSGTNEWSSGQVFAVLGNTGNGRIELNASDSPRIQVLQQGAAYNTQTEVIRLGDLNGNWGYGSETYGLAIGEYASNKPNIVADPTNGLRIRSYTTDKLTFDTSGNASIAGSFTIGTSGGIYQGSGTFASPTTGLKLYNSSGTGVLAGYLSGVVQAQFNTSGEIEAGGGLVKLNASGIDIAPTTARSDTRSYKFLRSGVNMGGLSGTIGTNTHAVFLRSEDLTDENSNVTVESTASSATRTATSTFRSTYSSNVASVTAESTSSTSILTLGGRFVHSDHMNIGSNTFPASPADGYSYSRTDLEMWAQYDGTRWQTMHELPLAFHSYGGPSFSVTTSNIAVTMLRGDIAAYLRRMSCNVSVATTHDASNYWTVTVSNASGTFWTFDTYDAGAGRTTAANVNARVETTTFAAQPTIAMTQINVSITKVGAPGNLTIYVGGWYRHVLT